MRYLVIGGKGQLGSEIVELAEAGGHEAFGLSHGDLDITWLDDIERGIMRCRPQVVVNTAAMHNVDACEQSAGEAMAVNAEGARMAGLFAAKVGAFYIYISTDYVFGGHPPIEPPHYKSDDPPSPINAYGWTKAMGEYVVRTACPNSAVVRVSFMFGKRASKQKGGNFVDKLLTKLRAGEDTAYYSDVTVSPTYARHAADAILGVTMPGTYHASNSGFCSVHEFASYVALMAGFDPQIRPVTHKERPERLRPTYTPLCPSFPTPRWEDGVREYLAEVGALAVTAQDYH